MSEDFKSVFFDEATEHLQAIEDELLVLDGDRTNSDALDAVFRAAHSIKGSAGMFGFLTLSEFTHHLETLLDQVRKGKADLTEPRVEIVLACVDEIRVILDRLEAGEDNPPADQGLIATLQAENTAVRDPGSASAVDAGTPSGDDSFGLFEDEPADDGFGLFDDEPEDDSFGLFAEEDTKVSDPVATKGPASAYSDYFDEMLRDDDEPALAAESKPERAREEPDAVAERAGDEDPDGKFGWLNRPAATGKSSPEAHAGAAAGKPAAGPASNGSRAEKSSGSLRVSLDKVDQLVNQISELVITQAMLRETSANLDVVENEQHLACLETLERTARELQDSVLSIRLLPVKFLFSRFPRVVRDLARQLGKKVQLVTLGEQAELDKSVIEKLSDPLTHLIRNSVDHGVESPEVRLAAGKPEQGQVVMSASHEGGDIVISISDDGAGINREKVLAKAIENGLPASEDWTDEQVFSLIFEPGFSTAAQVSDVSGRGVGMDVVKRNIKELGGRVDVRSSLGQGSVFTVRLPLTLAITDGMVLRCADQRLVIPLSNVVESLQLGQDDVFHIQGDGCVIRRHGEFIPLYQLSSLVGGTNSDTPAHGALMAIIVESEGQQMGLLVDELIGQQQIVIKNLETNYRRVPGYSGATVMGDGSVAFILDVAGLVTGAVPLDRPSASFKAVKQTLNPGENT